MTEGIQVTGEFECIGDLEGWKNYFIAKGTKCFIVKSAGTYSLWREVSSTDVIRVGNAGAGIKVAKIPAKAKVIEC